MSFAKYLAETNMHTKFGTCAIYAKYLMGIYERCINIYVPHIASLALNTQQASPYTYLTYFTEQYNAHISNIAHRCNMQCRHIYSTLLCIYAKTQPITVLYFTCNCQICATNKYAHQTIYIDIYAMHAKI